MPGRWHVRDVLTFILAAVAVIVALQYLADRTGLPAAALLTVAGLVYGVLPGPNVTLDPRVLLPSVTPPLIYSAALNSSLLAIRENMRTVISLSIGLVLATAVVTGIGMDLFVPWVGLVRARGRRGRRRRAGRRAVPHRPGGRAGRRRPGRAAAQADHDHRGRGAAQRRHRADHADRGGHRGDQRRLLVRGRRPALPAVRGGRPALRRGRGHHRAAAAIR